MDSKCELIGFMPRGYLLVFNSAFRTSFIEQENLNFIPQ